MKTFKQADQRVLQAMVRMQGADMAPLFQFFNLLLEETKSALIHARGDTVPLLQGRGGFLEEFVEAVKSAASVLEK